jgi:AraC family transcriptional regulator
MKFFGATGGHILRSRTSGDFTVIETLYPTMLEQPRHAHRFASFSFVSNGEYLEKIGSKTFGRAASTVVFHPPDESHSVKYQSSVRILSVHFSFEKLAQIREHSNVLDRPSSCRTQTAVWLGTKLGHELRRTDIASILVTEGLVLEMLGEAAGRTMSSSEKGFPRWLKETRDLLHETIGESPSLADLAKIAGVHPAHLSRVFRQKFGCTVGEYCRRLQFEYACQQIVATDKRLSQIASEAGFSDQSHLNRTFKNILNVTPFRYRKLVRPR